MLTIQIKNEDLAKRIQEVSEAQNQSYEEIIEEMFETFYRRHLARLEMEGMFDDDITDMSTTVRETMKQFYEQRSESSD